MGAGTSVEQLNVSRRLAAIYRVPAIILRRVTRVGANEVPVGKILKPVRRKITLPASQRRVIIVVTREGYG
jgi:hypothetical protein